MRRRFGNYYRSFFASFTSSKLINAQFTANALSSFEAMARSLTHNTHADKL
jgi:hypothetical protein